MASVITLSVVAPFRAARLSGALHIFFSSKFYPLSSFERISWACTITLFYSYQI
jgi:hypothetical protein